MSPVYSKDAPPKYKGLYFQNVIDTNNLECN